MNNKIKNVCDKIVNHYNIKKYGVICDNTLKIFGRLYFHVMKNSVTIGKNCVIRSSKHTNTLGGMDECRFVTYGDGKIILGNNVGITNSCLNSHIKITIQNDVLIGADCKIYDSDFHSTNYETRNSNDDKSFKSQAITIKEGAWIGAHSIILKGVTIGSNSIVGAGSVVTKDIPDNEIWAGNPAKFVKKVS